MPSALYKNHSQYHTLALSLRARSLLRCYGSIRCSIRCAMIRASKSSPPSLLRSKLPGPMMLSGVVPQLAASRRADSRFRHVAAGLPVDTRQAAAAQPLSRPSTARRPALRENCRFPRTEVGGKLSMSQKVSASVTCADDTKGIRDTRQRRCSCNPSPRAKPVCSRS